jgi:predicted site-specific integrase-resolvase
MMRITEASKAIGVSPTTLRRWVRKGLVPVIKTPRNRWFWTVAQLMEIRRGMNNKADAWAKELDFEE